MLMSCCSSLQKAKLMSWSVNKSLARDVIVMAAHRKRNVFNNFEHSREDGQIGSTRVCKQTDTHRFRHSVMQYNSGLLNISSDTFSHNSVAGTEKDFTNRILTVYNFQGIL